MTQGQLHAIEKLLANHEQWGGGWKVCKGCILMNGIETGIKRILVAKDLTQTEAKIDFDKMEIIG